MVDNNRLTKHYLTVVRYALVAYLWLAIFGNVINNVLQAYGLPNIATILRSFILLFLILLVRKDNYKSSHKIFFLIGLLWLIYYLLISYLDNSLYYGVYFARLYIEPIVVLYIGYFALQKCDTYKIIINIKIIAIASVFFSAFTVIAYYMRLSIFNLLYANEIVNSNWFLGGREVYRAGMPIGGPNQLGLLFSIMIMLNLRYPDSRSYLNLIYTFMLLCGLTLTFSKSALLVLILYLIYNSFLGMREKITMMKYILIFFLICISLIIVDAKVFDGYIFEYSKKIMKKSDTSTIGHEESIFEAIRNINEYILSGYPRGSVGPRAQQFTVDYKNVESSVFLLLYDMGLLGALSYCALVISLIAITYSNRIQIPYILATSATYMFLPLLHCLEVTSVVFFVYLVFGLPNYPAKHI